MSEPVLYDRRDDGAVIVTLNVPERRNALSRALVAGLEDAFARIAADGDVRGVVLAAAGGKAFCAGADLKERAEMSDAEVRDFVGRLQALTDTVAACPVPVIAAVDGYALGGGLELALACDLRLVSSTATVGLVEVRLGIIPGAGGTQRLTRAVGVARAKELIFTGRRLRGAEAAELGLALEVVEPDALLPRALALVAEIAKAAPLAVRQAKIAIDEGADLPLDQGLAAERAAYARLVPTEDRVEALAAFREKRPPVFKGR